MCRLQCTPSRLSLQMTAHIQRFDPLLHTKDHTEGFATKSCIIFKKILINKCLIKTQLKTIPLH